MKRKVQKKIFFHWQIKGRPNLMNDELLQRSEIIKSDHI